PGDNDLTHLKRRYGFRFASLFDTAVGARFLGAAALGLDVLLERYLGTRLPPSRQKDDWSARPLTEAQLYYAAADVFHLIELKGRLVDELARWGDAILEAVARGLALGDDELPRIEHRPRPRIAAAVQRRIERLRQWRSEAAPRVGIEPGLLLPNRLITVIALAGPRDRAELA